jgi:urea transport system ATP-binding protein
MLKVESLNQFYGSSQTLRNVSFEVPTGAVTALLGRNGVGKTTLLKCLMGVLPVASGSIELDGLEVSALPPYARVRLGMGYVPQGREIFSQLTVEENLRVGLGVRRHGPRSIPSRVFDLFPVLKQMLRRRGGDLSGGQQQQLAIGRALAPRPNVLLLDEPFSSLDAGLRDGTRRAVAAALAAAGTTAILVTHDQSEALSIATQVAVMLDGRLVQVGPPDLTPMVAIIVLQIGGGIIVGLIDPSR